MSNLNKKIGVILIISFLTLLSIDLKAQDFYSGDFRFGLGIAPNVSWFTPNTEVYENNGNKTGWSWGLNTDFFFAENYAFATGIKMLSYGGKLKYPDLYTDGFPDFKVTGESDIRFNAIHIPLALKMRTSMPNALNFYAKFGANMMFNYTRTEDYYTDPDSDINFEANDRDYQGSSNLFNFGILVGAGMEYNISGNTSAYAGIFFNQGILNQLSKKAYNIDANGVILDSEDSTRGPQGEKQKATLNYLDLELGIFF